jgi:hypothetical protein
VAVIQAAVDMDARTPDMTAWQNRMAHRLVKYQELDEAVRR